MKFHFFFMVKYAGDLTDAKTRDGMGSRQILSEWKHYKQVLEETQVTKHTQWLDVRGNHGESITNFSLIYTTNYNNFNTLNIFQTISMLSQ